MSSPVKPSGRNNPRTVIRMVSIFLYDVLVGALSMGVSVHIRYILENKPAPDFITLKAAAIFGVACALVFPMMGLHRGVWRYTALNDVVRILQAIIVANLVFLPFIFLFNRADDLPRTAVFLVLPLLTLLMVTPRLLAVFARTGALTGGFRFEDRRKEPAILVGDEAALDVAMRDLFAQNGSAPFRVKALIETGGGHAGRAIHGTSVVGGMPALLRTVRRLERAEQRKPRIIMADPKPDPEILRDLLKIAGAEGVRISRARPSGDAANAFSPIEASDLLNRAPRASSGALARSLIEGQVVFVTGAGGTIGSELVRRASILKPKKLILYDSAEVSLYEIDMELKRQEGAPEWRSVLGDIRDQRRLAKIFDEEKPDIVLHAAALKHVPLMEDNAAEVVMTNVEGTRRVIQAAQAANVKTVALISTDKAVNPSSVMGAAKRAAELYVRSVAQDDSMPRLCVTRFGNVLGSAGSVIPLFERQIESGQPVTVTDPEATRYFMTVEEACGLVLDAAALAASPDSENGALFVFDMGDPVPIPQIARELMRMRGRDPDAPGAIRYMGLRPGEKLHEALVYDYEDMGETPASGVLKVSGAGPVAAQIIPKIDALVEAARSGEPDRVRARLTDLIPEYQPNFGPGDVTADGAPDRLT